MMNMLGKSLVLIHTTLSLIALAWAAGAYFSFLDWGWKEPRRAVELRNADERKAKKSISGVSPLYVPSEYDQRVATLREAAKARDLVVPAIKKNYAAWKSAAQRFGENHLFYVQELTRLKSAPGIIDIKEITYKGGDPVLETTVLGQPKLEGKVPGLTKSQAAYAADLKKVLKDLDDVTKDTLQWIVKVKDVTFNLTGKDDMGKAVKDGLYALVEKEYQAQNQVKFEKSYLQPNWSRALDEAELFRDRRDTLQETLDRMIKKKK